MSDVIEAASVRVSTLADGTLRLVLDIEPRHAQDAFKLFGSPGTAVALAALKSAESLSKSDKPAKPVQSERERMGPLCEYAVRVCREPQFQNWISRIYDMAMGGNGQGWGDVRPADFKDGLEGYARHAVLVLCDVDSRKKLDTEPGAAARLHEQIRKPYAAWLQKQGVTA